MEEFAVAQSMGVSIISRIACTQIQATGEEELKSLEHYAQRHNNLGLQSRWYLESQTSTLFDQRKLEMR